MQCPKCYSNSQMGGPIYRKNLWTGKEWLWYACHHCGYTTTTPCKDDPWEKHRRYEKNLRKANG